MYAIIFWRGKGVYPVLENGQMKLFSSLKEADDMAWRMEDVEKVEYRVISISPVNE